MTVPDRVSRSKRVLLKAAVSLLLAPPVPKSVAAAKPGKLFLEETHVAGTAYYGAALVIGRLRPGDALVLRRQPANPHDGLAIEVLTADGVKLGYVPRADNAPYARLLDADRKVTARVSQVRPGRWDDVCMELHLAG